MNIALRESLAEPETLWHQCLLVTILIVAACTRFYSLDQISLSAEELRNLATCEIKGWLAMVMDYHANNGGTPPLYPMLLCIVTHLTSNTEFFARSLSALAGLAAIYFIYITGRDFISPTVGLLATAVIATELRSILLGRDATLYPLLALWCLIHNYYFCKLFFSTDPHNPLGIRSSGTTFHFEWSWRPKYPADARYLAGFWLSGLAAFYTSPMALILVLSELLTSAYLIKNSGNFTNWRIGMRSLWLPLLIGALPWLPMFYKNSAWILDENLFAFQGAAVVWQQIRNLSPIDAALQYLLILLLVIFALSIIILNIKSFKLSEKIPRHTNHFSFYILFQLGIATISLWLIIPACQLSYVYFWWIFLLLLLVPVSLGLDIIHSTRLKNILVGFTVFGILIIQINSNTNFKLYSLRVNADFRLAAKIIHDDEEFMKGSKNIIMSSDLFKHHLDAAGITTSNITLFNGTTPPDAANLLPNNSEFYYLEFSPIDKKLKNETPEFQALSSQYKTICMTKIFRIRIVKFSSDASAVENGTPDCQVYLDGTVSLK